MAEVIGHWTTKNTPSVALCADPYFGGHAPTKACVSLDTIFLFLTKRDEFGVLAMGHGITPGHVSTATHRRGHYSMAVYKNPKVGSKPLHVVPLLTNCTFENWWWWSGRAEIPCEIGAYRQLAGVVDTANQLALRHREVGRFRLWSKALRTFVLSCTISTSFVAWKSIALIPEHTSLWDSQLGFVHSVMCTSTCEELFLGTPWVGRTLPHSVIFAQWLQVAHRLHEVVAQKHLWVAEGVA